jgi:hypothetical protein
VLALATTPAALEAQVRLEQPDALLIGGEFGESPEALAALLKRLALPAAIIAPADWEMQPLAGLAAVLPPGTSWLEALAALPATAPQSTSPAPAIPPARPAAPLTPAALLPSAVGPAPLRLLIAPLLGGVGASGLTLALAAAGAEAGFRTLALSLDPLAFTARLGIAATEHRILRSAQEGLFINILDRPEWPAASFDWQICDGARRWTELPTAPLVLLTRPTGEGRLAVVRALAELKSRAVPVAALILNRPGSLSVQEFTRLCTADLGSCPPIYTLPDDPTVPELEDMHGHALESILYGPAIRRLARLLAPTLPWPALDSEKTFQPPAPGNFRFKLPRVEVTE